MSQPASEYAPPRESARAGRPYAIGAFVCAVVAVFFLPIVLGPVAVVLGVVAYRKGDRLGRWAIAAGVLGTVLGFALGALVFNATKDGALVVQQAAALLR